MSPINIFLFAMIVGLAVASTQLLTNEQSKTVQLQPVTTESAAVRQKRHLLGAALIGGGLAAKGLIVGSALRGLRRSYGGYGHGYGHAYGYGGGYGGYSTYYPYVNHYHHHRVPVYYASSPIYYGNGYYGNYW